MLTESYVSFEIAKLLKEKGFEQDYYYNNCPVYWINGNNLYWINRNNPTLPFEGDDGFPYNQNECVAPSLATAMKWLREVHKIEISISYGFPFIDGKQVFKYYWCPVKVTEKGLEYPMDDPNTAEFNEEMADSYEQAIEAALLYVLKILI